MNEVEFSTIEECLEDVEEAFADSDASEENTAESSELDLLKTEIEELRAEIKSRDERERVNSRILQEIKEFGDYFPDVDIHEIPDEVWEKVKNGMPLSASFALNLRKMELEKKKISDFNEKNRRMSTGSLVQGEGEKYYSPSEVKKMTPAQVKSHYDEIVASMRHWN